MPAEIESLSASKTMSTTAYLYENSVLADNLKSAVALSAWRAVLAAGPSGEEQKMAAEYVDRVRAGLAKKTKPEDIAWCRLDHRHP